MAPACRRQVPLLIQFTVSLHPKKRLPQKKIVEKRKNIEK